MSTGRKSRERGASILELAFLLPVMLLLVMGVIDLARGYQLHIQLENAASEGASFAHRYPNDVSCEPDGIVSRVHGEEPGVDATPDFTVTVFAEDETGGMATIDGCGDTDVGSGQRVRVDVTATFDVLTPMVARVVGSELSLTGSAEVEVR